MDQAGEILELQFEGNGINPSSVKPREIAELILNFEAALLSTIKDRHPEIDTSELLFTFDQIRHESLDLRFIPKRAVEVIISSYALITTSIAAGDFTGLTKETITSLKSITKFSKNHDCLGRFTRNGEVLSSFTPSTEIQFNKPLLMKSETTIFGKLMDSGGENPNVHIKINDDYTLIFNTSEQNAKILAGKLYEYVALSGTAKWNADTMKLEEFKLTDILEFKPGNALKAMAELKNLTSGYWDQFNSNDEINEQLLRD